MSVLLQYIIVTLALILISLFIVYLWKRKNFKFNKVISIYEKDLHDLKDSNEQYVEERKVLIQEIHHRVKNNLQIIASLLRVLVRNSEEKKIVFNPNEMLDRINSISELQNLIYGDGEINKLKIEEYLTALIRGVLISKQRFSDHTKIIIRKGNVDIDINALVPLSIIIHELVLLSIINSSNEYDLSLIELNFKEGKHFIYMNYSDSGSFTLAENNLEESLIDIFTEQLNGSYTIEKDNQLSTFRFKFSKKMY